MPNNPSGANPNRRRLRLIQYERLRSSAPLELIAEDLRHLPGLAFIANGVTGHNYLTADPYAWVDWLPGQPEGDALAQLSNLVLAGHGEVQAGPVPFSGGAIGQIEYEAGYCFDRVRNCRAPAGRRLMRFGLYGWVIAHDEGKGETWMIVNGADPRPQTGLSDRRSLLTALRTRRRAIPRIRSSGAICDFTRSGYMQTVEQIQRYIAAGDVYQVNVARRLSGRLGADPWNVFLRLRQSGTDPMAAFLSQRGQSVISASPELLLLHQKGIVQTRPIKGTRPRGENPVADQVLAEELVMSPKDRAENVMIVDVLRNDLGKIAEPGSVAVERLLQIVTNQRIHHLESTISARVTGPARALDLLRSMFPGGSVTGAPKLRAMEIIAELEPVTRGGYCGAIVQVGFDGYVSASIPIRTIYSEGREWQFHVGGGIVADSQPPAEYKETQHKAAALLSALGAV